MFNTKQRSTVRTLCFVLGLVLALAWALNAEAARLRISWIPYDAPETEFLMLWERTPEGRNIIVENIPVSDSSVEFDVADNEMTVLYLSAVRDGMESEPSNPKVWQGDIALPAILIRPGPPVINDLEEVN